MIPTGRSASRGPAASAALSAARWRAGGFAALRYWARPRVIGEIEANGLRLTSFDGFEHRLAAKQAHVV